MIKIDGVDVIDLLKWAGQKRFAGVLPPPLVGYVGDHDTGCQPKIWAIDTDGKHDRILVWQDSRWYSHIYEFNDKGKILGIQPDCEWAKGAIEKAFRALIDMRAEDAASAAVKQRDRLKAEVDRRRAAMSHYASILSNHPSQT